MGGVRRSAESLLLVLFCTFLSSEASGETPARQIIAQAIVAEEPDQPVSIRQLIGNPDPSIPPLLIAWKEGEIFIYEPVDDDENPTGEKIPITFSGEKDGDDTQNVVRLDTVRPLIGRDQKPMRLSPADVSSADTTSELRIAMKEVLDVFALVDADPKKRLRAIEEIGFAQDAAKLSVLSAREREERDAAVARAIRVATAMIGLRSEDPAVQISSCETLGSMSVIASQDALITLAREAAADKPAVASAAGEALRQIAQHVKWVNVYGTLFRGLSAGSVLLVIAIGLAISFGLMGVINMAHGELIAIGAYSTYLVQCIFGAGLTVSPFGAFTINFPGLGTSGAVYESYFLVAIPLSFLVAALFGVLLERGVIQFLYRRPLESLLATWGVSLVLQQVFRSVFGANNVQVDSPSWLSGNWTVSDVMFGWNRLFVIGFAAVIIGGTWLVLNKTSLGLQIRAVMQNRSMAACMGVRTSRVNMLTFAFGSGLAGLAGAFLSQIGNVGPSMGQDHIVSAFMTVVVGGVGSLAGTVISAVGIGVTDQSLQQVLGNPVLGKILVLGVIIVFLQWKPAGLFTTSSRNLES